VTPHNRCISCIEAFLNAQTQRADGEASSKFGKTSSQGCCEPSQCRVLCRQTSTAAAAMRPTTCWCSRSQHQQRQRSMLPSLRRQTAQQEEVVVPQGAQPCRRRCHPATCCRASQPPSLVTARQACVVHSETNLGLAAPMRRVVPGTLQVLQHTVWQQQQQQQQQQPYASLPVYRCLSAASCAASCTPTLLLWQPLGQHLTRSPPTASCCPAGAAAARDGAGGRADGRGAGRAPPPGFGSRRGAAAARQCCRR
jgi:hypothetical protein